MKSICILCTFLILSISTIYASNCRDAIGTVVTPKPKGIVQSEIDRLKLRYNELDREWDRLDHQALTGKQTKIAKEMAEIQKKLDFLVILQKSR